MSKLRISSDLTFPLELVTESVAILAARRAGKSHTAKKLTEQLHKAGQQFVVVDPKGDWWGLRSSADGKDKGLPVVILGGEHGDIPLEVGAGELVAKLVVEQRVSLVLDLSEFRKNAIAQFMTAFLETLYRMKARDQYRTPLMLVIDEADAIAPQKPYKGEERMLGAAEDIVRRGGQRGIGIIMVSQRAAVLNKNVLTQCGVLILLRTTGSQDIDAVDEWIKKHGQPAEREQVMATIATMPRGTAWVWAPGWPTPEGIFRQVGVGAIETFDSGATPKPGQKQVRPTEVADVDLEAFRREMATTIEKAKSEDPRELRRRIQELEREAKKVRPAPAAAVVATKVSEKRVEVPVLKDAQLKRLEGVVAKLNGVGLNLVQFGERVVVLGQDVVTVGREITVALANLHQPGNGGRRPPPTPAPVRTVAPPRAALAIARQGRPPSADGEGKPSGALQRILDALAELQALGVDRPERVQVAFLAGYTHLNSKGFTNALGAARSGGLIDYPTAGTIALTEAGWTQANPAHRPRTPEEVQERVLRLLGGSSERLLRPLIEAYPNEVSRADLAAAAGYGHLNSKGFVNAIGRLRSLGFIDYPSPGLVVAQPVLFLEAAYR